jgi:GntR family transcriptional regulator
MQKGGMMVWTIDFRDKRPIYEQIVSGIEDEIINGLISPDEPLPSVRSLATDLSINPNTIQKAYRQLEADGFTYSVPGRGSFVKNTEGVKEMKKKEVLRDLTDLIRRARELGVTEDEIKEAIKGDNRK